MEGYLCKNLDLKLKNRVFIGLCIMVLNFIVLLVGLKSCVTILINPNNMDMSFFIVTISISIGVLGSIIVKQYVDDFRSTDKYQEIIGKVVYIKKDVVMLESLKDGELITFLISREVLNHVELKEGVSIKMIRTRKSGLIKELTLIK